MFGIASVLIVVFLSLLITRVATIALTVTGLSREIARFQARSALTGAGFTTSESEDVVDHPVRRRIILFLMLLGNAGLITIAGSLIVSFANAGGPRPTLLRLGLLVAGLFVLLLLARSDRADVYITRMTTPLLKRWTDLDLRDYVRLLHLSGEYGISELKVQKDDWLAGRSLGELKLRDEGVVVLGVRKPNGEYAGVPRGTTILEPGDVLLLYARSTRLAELDERKSGAHGDDVHRAAVAEQRRSEDESDEGGSAKAG